MAVKYQFSLPCRPISVNQSKRPFIQKSEAFTKLRFASTDKYKEAQRSYHSILILHKNKLREILESERAMINGVHFEFEFYLTNMENKKGTINLKGGDLDNFLKGIIDAIFSIVHSNDAIVKKLSAEKIQSDEDKIVVKISECLRR